MNIGGEIKETYKSIPSPVKSFLKRALLVFIVWKLIYHLFLFNGRVIDAPLTHITSFSTSKVLSKIYYGNTFFVREDCKPVPGMENQLSCMDDIYMNYRKVIGISDFCNGLELYALYLGFLLCVPGAIKRAISFMTLGLIVIYVANILRCVTIAVMGINQNRLTDIAHHYIFKLVVYLLIFLMWVIYFKKSSSKHSYE